jgi:hypothetical protein
VLKVILALTHHISLAHGRAAVRYGAPHGNDTAPGAFLPLTRCEEATEPDVSDGSRGGFFFKIMDASSFATPATG